MDAPEHSPWLAMAKDIALEHAHELSMTEQRLDALERAQAQLVSSITTLTDMMREVVRAIDQINAKT